MSEKNNSNNNDSTGLGWDLVCTALALLFFTAAVFGIWLRDISLVVCPLILAIVFGMLGVPGLVERISRRVKKVSKIVKNNAAVASGNWEFPCAEYYRKMKLLGIEIICDCYTAQKARKIAENILDDSGIRKGREKFTTTELLKKYLEEGKTLDEKQIKAAEELAKAAREKRMRTPAKSSVSDSVKASIALAERVSGLYGTEKRAAMINAEIEVLEQMQKQFRAVADMPHEIIMNTHQEKPMNEAIWGGIGSAIGGAGGGYFAVREVAKENKIIERRNAKAMAESRAKADALRATADSALDEVYKLGVTIRGLKAEISGLKDKIVYTDVGMKELVPAVMITTAIFNTLSYGYGTIMELNFLVQNNYKLPFKTDKLVLDGSIRADISCKGIPLETVNIPLPKYGIPFGGQCLLSRSFTKYLPEAETWDYSAVFSFNSLWIVEK